MKINWNKKYTTIAAYTFITICLSIVFFHFMMNIEAYMEKYRDIVGVLQPFTIGFIIAYLLSFILNFFEQRVFQLSGFPKLSKKLKKGLGIVCTYITAGLISFIFLNFVLPQLLESIAGIVNNIPAPTDLNEYTNNLTRQLRNYFDLTTTQIDFINERIYEFTGWFIQLITDSIPVFLNSIMNFASSLWNIALGLIISVYLLVAKENLFALSNKIISALFSQKHTATILELGNRTNSIFGRFISGRILDSTIIGILTFIVLAIFDMPFTALIAFIVGVTNIIPFFGPFIGAIPSAIIILFESPIQALWFCLIILIIQQIDGNIIGPKIMGDSIGISSFWILFSILVAGNLFGIVGMIMGVPLFALIYSIAKDIIEFRIKQKGLPIDTDVYRVDKS